MRIVSALLLSILLVIPIFTSSLFIHKVDSEPTTIMVPDDYPTIVEAIGHASSGDTIFVKNGTYNEQVLIDKPISLIGQNKASTIINGSTSDPIVHVTADFVEITGFTVASTLESWIANPHCIDLEGTQNCVVSNNIVLTCGFPIRLTDSDKNTISGNIFAGEYQHHGISLVNSDFNTITGNSQNVLVDVSLDLSRSNDNFISMNKFDDNFATAVVVEESNRNAFTGNRIVSAVLPGISIISSNGTKAYHNYIEGHESLGSGIRDVSIDGNSFYSSWDNGYPCGGNSWYGFNGPDDYSGKLQSFIGGDWIIDTPYMVSADSQDNYPFKETDGWTNHPILINSNVTVTRSWVKTYAAYVTTADIPGNTGSMSVAMPKLNSTHIRVYVDGIALPDPSLVQTDNGTHYSIYFEFTTGAHEITIQYAPTGDINADGVINILDLVKIAVTFGITIYDSVWSLDADVNNDKRVNIVDIVTVAIHFGHTG